jgi:hypothetical protein
MKSFWNSPWDAAVFNRDYTRLLVLALVVHVFYQDWGMAGAFGVPVACFAFAMWEGYVRFSDARAKPPQEDAVS